MKQDVQEFISAIAKALGPDRPAPDPDGIGPPAYFVSRSAPEDAERFLDAWTALGGKGRYTVGREGARSALREILAEEKARTAVRWRDPLLDDIFGPPEASEEVFGCRINVVDAREARPVRVAGTANADAGIVVADFAVAATGTIIHRSGGDRLKSVSLLPPVLVALVDRARVVDILSAAIREMREWLSDPGKCQGLQMISGPSRSSDIENDLTIGVHGPGTVHVLIMNGEF